MTQGTEDRGNGAQLVELAVADEPEAWAAAGFAVVDDAVTIGATTIRLTGTVEGSRGITSWSLAGLDLSGLGADGLDGLPTRPAAATVAPSPAHAPAHPNGTIGLDHVVVATPDLDRTIAALAEVGLGCRRIRDTESHGSPMRQAFFRLGGTVLEVVSGDTGSGLPAADDPARWFGLCVDVDDLDATAGALGDGLGRVKVAVQPGRRIATLRHKAFGLTVAVAAMDHHADR